jgi:hypothetical protein
VCWVWHAQGPGVRVTARSGAWKRRFQPSVMRFWPSLRQLPVVVSRGGAFSVLGVWTIQSVLLPRWGSLAEAVAGLAVLRK